MTIYYATAAIALACVANSYGIWMLARAHRMLSARVGKSRKITMVDEAAYFYGPSSQLLKANFPATCQAKPNIDPRIL